MNKGDSMKASIVISIVSLLELCVLGTFQTCYCFGFSMGCEQYLKRAADANTVTLAAENLTVALTYIEKNELTNGVVSIFLNQPENDLGYWYKNLKSSLTELEKVEEGTSQLERSNLLMKLRETLTDVEGGEGGGTCVTAPNGISIYPQNVSYFWLYLMLSLLCPTSIIVCCARL